MNGIGLVIAMASATVGGAVTQKILTSLGKVDEASWLDLAVKCSLGITALTAFITFIKTLKTLA